MEKMSKWHTERQDYDYRYHWIDITKDRWWVKYRAKEKKEKKDGTADTGTGKRETFG